MKKIRNYTLAAIVVFAGNVSFASIAKSLSQGTYEQLDHLYDQSVADTEELAKLAIPNGERQFFKGRCFRKDNPTAMAGMMILKNIGSGPAGINSFEALPTFGAFVRPDAYDLPSSIIDFQTRPLGVVGKWFDDFMIRYGDGGSGYFRVYKEPNKTWLLAVIVGKKWLPVYDSNGEMIKGAYSTEDLHCYYKKVE